MFNTMYFTCKNCGAYVDDGVPLEQLCLNCADKLFVEKQQKHFEEKQKEKGVETYEAD